MQALRSHGPKARLPHSREVLETARRQWWSDKSTAHEILWRQAAIAHSAARAFAGDWGQAAMAADPNPQWVPFDSDQWPHPTTPATTRLAALMLINNAVSRLHCKTGWTHLTAQRALNYIVQLGDPTLSPWRAVALLLIAHERGTNRAEAAAYASAALPFLNRIRQPELLSYANWLLGRGDGLAHPHRLRPNRPAGFRATECLYYFND
ncbi:MAG TPA: hypothetical protein VLF67_00740, partial [Candidatus Saccharimonas sp.]|nr:hypothetical protein [Candidatus Saccharimonas sp.]